MRRILIMNLTRMGDLLESAPMLRAIRLAEPASHLTMVVNETFRETAELLEDVDQILSFPLFDFAHDLREGDEDLVDLYRRLEAFADLLGTESYDLALNITNSRLSGWLMGFVRARQWRGLRYDEQGGRQVLGPFVRYFGANDFRRYGPFNLSDFMLTLYGLPEAPCAARLRIPGRAEEEADRLLEGAGASPLLGLQAGASEACKRWRVRDFAEAARWVLEHSDASVVLLGSGEERPLAEAIVDRLPGLDGRVIDLVGRTSVSTLAAVVRRLGALLSNDTGTMHLAAALGVRAVNLSLGSAFFRETAPYGPGHLVVEPRIDCRPCNFYFECGHFDCKRLLPPAFVGALALSCLRREDIRALVDQAPGTLDLYQTGFDADGLLETALLTPRPLRADEVLLQVFRVVVCQSELGGELEQRFQDLERRLQIEGRGLHPGGATALRATLLALDELEALAEEGMSLASQARTAVLSAQRDLLQALLAKMDAQERRLLRFNQDHVDCRLLIRALVLELESTRGSRLDVLLGGHLSAYRRLSACVCWTREALSRALVLLEPASAPVANAGASAALPV